MPAVITHHLFGEDALARMPEGLIDGQEETLAFLLANQGPDPFFLRFSTWPRVADACHRLAKAMHDRHVVKALFSAREAVTQLPEEDAVIGRAFTLGMVAHYVLDSRTHPFVYQQQDGIAEADPTLADCKSEIHAIIESEIDAWMLYTLRGQTVLDAPVPANLAHTDRVVRVGGALFSQVAQEVFDIQVGVEEYAGAISDYELTLAIINPPTALSKSAVTAVEHLVRGKSYLRSMACPIQVDDDCPAANLTRRPWANSATGKTTTESIPDLYYQALEDLGTFFDAYTSGDFLTFEELTGHVNYNGVVR